MPGTSFAAMQYFVNSFDGDKWTRDDTGLQADDLEQARMMAQGGLADMVRSQAVALPWRR